MFLRKRDVQIRNMTQGNPAKLILGFALPLMLGNVFQQFYTFVDTMVVGQAMGVQALAALGAVDWLIFLMFGLAQGVVQGFSVVISQRFGAEDEEGLKRAVFQAMLLTGTAAVFLTVLAQAGIARILVWMGTPEEIRSMSLLYLRILYAGLPVAFLYNLLAALLRAVGNSQMPLRAMTLSSLCNIVLDVLFVFGLHLGIGGAAAATVLSQIAASLFCLYHISKIEQLRLHREHCVPDRKLIREQLGLGLPMGAQNMITSLGGLVVQSVVNGFGVTFIAGYTAATKLYGLLEIAAGSYGYAMSTYAGQNMGAGKTARIGQGLRAANLIGAATAYLMSAVMFFFGRAILGCFLTGDAALVNASMETGYYYLCVLAVAFPLLYILYITRASVQGMGNAVFPMVSSMIQLLMRVSCALFLTRMIGESAVFYGEVLAWAGADLFLGGCYLYLKKKLRKKKL